MKMKLLVILVSLIVTGCQSAKMKKPKIEFSSIIAQSPDAQLVGSWSGDMAGQNTLILNKDGTGLFCFSFIKQVYEVKYQDRSIVFDYGSSSKLLTYDENKLTLFVDGVSQTVYTLTKDPGHNAAADFCKQQLKI